MGTLRVIGLCFLSIFTWGQSAPNQYNHNQLENYLIQYLSTTGDNTQSSQKFLSYLNKLEKNKDHFHNESEFLEFIFNKIHNKYLRDYRDQASFADLFEKGGYNCLTGTALYAIALAYFNFDYNIIETNYHIFIVANVSNQSIMLETTDPFSGFISDQKTVNKRLSYYQKEQPYLSSGKNVYKLNCELFNCVGLDQLTGLLYYNLSTAAFNSKELTRSIQLLDNATRYYRSPRIEEFSKIILTALIQSNLEASVKQSYAAKIKSLL